MRLLRAISEFAGVGGDRSAQPPRYLALADGLVVTETKAEAWFKLKASNTDLMSEQGRDAELDEVASALSRILVGYECHLKIVWSSYDADRYLAEAETLFIAGDWQRWAADRAARLAQLDLPVRHLLLGVQIEDRTASKGAAARRRAETAAGIRRTGLGRKDLRRLSAVSRRLGKRLEMTPWKATPATVDLIAWGIARELHRSGPLPAPAEGVVSGASLAQLTRGRVMPYPDHLQVVDATGSTVSWATVLTMPAFPQTMTSPGGGEWLRVLSEMTYVPDDAALDDGDIDEEDQELILPVLPEASIRFRVLPKPESLTRVDDTRKLAKEQRRSASKGSAGEAQQHVEETEGVMSDLGTDMQRRGTMLLEDHPRIIVSSPISLTDLRERVDAVITHYGSIGITAVTGEEEQRDLWLEGQIGDVLRVPDTGHTRDVQALAVSWWWGGSQVGDDSGPVCGILTGSTTGVFRNDITAGSERRDATTTAIIGRSGRGKTTVMMMAALDAAFRGSMVLALDFKGDLGGLVNAARYYDLPTGLVETGTAFAGCADLFTLLSAEGQERAAIEVPAQLGIAMPPDLRAAGAETPVQAAVNAAIAEGSPSTARVIELLRASPDDLAARTGEALYGLSLTPLGSPFMGRATGVQPLSSDPGVWVVQMPGLSLPKSAVLREDWNVVERMSVALMHSMLAYGITTAGRRDLRTLRKVVAVPEVHVLTATRAGASFLDYIARVGRALNTNLVLDTQDAGGIIEIEGVTEQLTTVYGFQLTTERQQNNLARLLELPETEQTRNLVRAIGFDEKGEIRHGHCIVRDRRNQSATVQIDVPTAELLELLDTSPKSQEDADGVDLKKTQEGVQV